MNSLLFIFVVGFRILPTTMDAKERDKLDIFVSDKRFACAFFDAIHSMLSTAFL
jgi:hypothetical protein